MCIDGDEYMERKIEKFIKDYMKSDKNTMQMINKPAFGMLSDIHKMILSEKVYSDASIL